MDAQTMTNIVNFALFAFVGVLLSRRVPAPRRWGWVVGLLALVIAPYIGVSARLIDISGLVFFFNIALQGFVFGVLAGWLRSK